MTHMVEKPSPEEAPSCSVAVGKYIITPEILHILGTMKSGASGEIRLADAFEVALANGEDIYAHDFEGTWLDTGDKFNFLRATIQLGLKHPRVGDQLKKYIKEVAQDLS